MKAVFVERFKRTFLDLIEDPMPFQDKAWWLNHLDAAMDKFNDGVHGTTKMTSFGIVMKNNTYKHNKHPKFQVVDFVRAPDKRKLYSKGYTTIWARGFLKYMK